MLLIDNVLVHDEVLQEYFACNLHACHGACCVEGDGGAPLSPAEAELLPSLRPQLNAYLTPEGKAALDDQGAYTETLDGELETPLIGRGGPCAYVVYENGTALCGIEKAWLAGAVTFRKPLSCHLYPIRVDERPPYQVLRYDRWDICAGGCQRGASEKIPLYIFLKEALTRTYGAEWYAQLEALAALRQTKLGASR